MEKEAERLYVNCPYWMNYNSEANAANLSGAGIDSEPDPLECYCVALAMLAYIVVNGTLSAVSALRYTIPATVETKSDTANALGLAGYYKCNGKWKYIYGYIHNAE